MTHEDDEVRRALEARSAAPSPEFRSRLSQALSARPAAPNLMPAIAAATVLVLTVTSVGVLLAARQLGRSHNPIASGARTESPSPFLIHGAFPFQLSAPSAGTLWALYDPDKLLRSTDQGSTWEIRSMPKDWGVHPVVSFIDDREGWWLAPGSPTRQCQEAGAVIWHTTDAGATWSQLNAKGIATSQCKNGIWFFDAKHGLLSAWDDTHPATIYRTNDGGQTWAAAQLVPDPPNYQSAQRGAGYEVRWMKAFGSTYYLGALGTPYVYRSNDGGASWKWVTKVPSLAVVMVTESRWLDFTAPGQAMESVNGGQQFHQFTSDLSTADPNATQLVFVDANVGYAASPGRLQRTVDGGSHWTVATTPGAAQPPTPAPSSSPIPMPATVSLSVPSANVVWALVAGQYLFLSTDQGNTWQERNMPQFKAAGTATAHIAFADDHDGWVFFTVESPDCGFSQATPTRRTPQQGVQVYRTTDGAATWALVDSALDGQVSAGGLPLEQCKTAFAFSDAQHGVVGTHDLSSTYVWRTSDGGMSWQQTELPASPTGAGAPRTIVFMQSFAGTFVLYAFDVYKSGDDGATWTYVGSYPTPLYFKSPVRWMVIFPASSSETLDAGKTWQDVPTDYHTTSTQFGIFVFADDQVGYSADPAGLLRTVDGGAHWVLIKTSWP